jgi:putative hydrolase of the HAD superfamily
MSEVGPDDRPMAMWPQVQIIEGAKEALESLYEKYPLCIATNASVSRKPMIERALERVDLLRYFSQVFCFTEIGYKKSDIRFWTEVSNQLNIPLNQIAMVGDSIEQDVLAPQSFGLFSVWFNESGRYPMPPEPIPTVTYLPDFAAMVCNDVQPQTIVLVRWQDLAPVDQSKVLQLEVSAQQLEFAGTVERAVENCEADVDDDAAGLAIRYSQEIMGFLVLKRRSKAPDWAASGAAVVSAMRIDQAHQGKGIGPAALEAIARWLGVHWPEASLLTLSVDEENTTGIRAYTKAGFQDHGEHVQGRIGWVRYMSKPIANFSPHHKPAWPLKTIV